MGLIRVLCFEEIVMLIENFVIVVVWYVLLDLKGRYWGLMFGS